MVARFLNVHVWDLPRVAIHYQEEARVILQAQYEARIHKQNQANKAGAMTVDIFLPEF